MNHRIDDKKKLAAIRKTVLTGVLHLIFSSNCFRDCTVMYDMEELRKNYSVNRKTAVSNYTYILLSTLQYITQRNFHLTNFSVFTTKYFSVELVHREWFTDTDLSVN